MNGSLDTPHRPSITVHQQSRVLEVGFRRRRAVPHPVRADARLLAVGRGAGPRPGPGGAADRQARRRARRRSSRSATTPCSRRFSDGHDTGIFSWDYLYFLGSQQDELWQQYEERLAEAGRRPRRADAAAARRHRLRPFALNGAERDERDPLRLRDGRRGDEGAARARRVRLGRAELRPDERPDVARPAPRLEGLRGGGGQRARRATGCSTSPAAPATWRARSPRRSAPRGLVVHTDINEAMLRQRPRPPARRRRGRCRPSLCDAETLPFADGALRPRQRRPSACAT